MDQNPYQAPQLSTEYPGTTNIPDLCPLCGRALEMRLAKRLYDQHVCKKCWYAFANRRQGAFVLDMILFRIMQAVAVTVLAQSLADAQVSVDTYNMAFLALDLVAIIILLAKDGFSGQSPGKAFCGVRVLSDRTGQGIGFGASILRNLPLLIPLLPLFIAAQLCKGYRWGDGLAASKVIWVKYANRPLFHPVGTAENLQVPNPE